MLSEIDIKDMKELNDYQDAAWATAMESARNTTYLYNGLAGETGELCSLYAKAIRDGIKDPYEYSDKIKKELGDVLWFVAGLSRMAGFTLQQVAEANIAKLNSRKERGVLSGSGDDR